MLTLSQMSLQLVLSLPPFVGGREPFMLIFSCVLTSFIHLISNVAVDFSFDSFSHLDFVTKYFSVPNCCKYCAIIRVDRCPMVVLRVGIVHIYG